VLPRAGGGTASPERHARQRHLAGRAARLLALSAGVGLLTAWSARGPSEAAAAMLAIGLALAIGAIGARSRSSYAR
jgi:hypothetical protein